jgi:hypothetical protein
MLVAIEPQGFNMNKFLIGFTYHEPESWELFQKGIIEDCESSTGVYITAPTLGEAIAWTERIAEELLRASNSDHSLNWKSLGYDCWEVEEPSNSDWSHCLAFFQSVETGVFPDLEKMGASAYGEWVEGR